MFSSDVLSRQGARGHDVKETHITVIHVFIKSNIKYLLGFFLVKWRFNDIETSLPLL